MDDIYKNVEEYNWNKKRKILTVYYDMIADILSNKNRSELFITGRKLNDSLVFILQSYFAVPKNVELNSTCYFVMKIPNKREFQEIAFNHSSDIDFQDSFFAKSGLQNHVLFCLLILLFHQIILYQPAWDLHWERHLRDLLQTSQKRWLLCDVFRTSQIHIKNDIFFVTPLRRLKYIFCVTSLIYLRHISIKMSVYSMMSLRRLKNISSK